MLIKEGNFKYYKEDDGQVRITYLDDGEEWELDALACSMDSDHRWAATMKGNDNIFRYFSS